MRQLKPIFFSVFIVILLSACSTQKVDLDADFSWYPLDGNSLTVYQFDASESHDLEDSAATLQYRWDWGADLIWDTDFSSVPYASNQFESGGINKVRLEIKDSKGSVTYIDKELDIIPIETGIFSDPRDQHEYDWVKIGNQVWMSENMHWKTEEGAWYNRGISFGRYYTWDAAMDACPEGWHLPYDFDWIILEQTTGPLVGWDEGRKGFYEVGEVGYKLKSRSGWSSKCNGSDIYEFNLQPAGYRNFNGKYARRGMLAYFWTASQASETTAFNRGFHYGSKGVSKASEDKRVGFSVRCIKDNVIHRLL